MRVKHFAKKVSKKFQEGISGIRERNPRPHYQHSASTLPYLKTDPPGVSFEHHDPGPCRFI
jgi:hypothetical protein